MFDDGGFSRAVGKLQVQLGGSSNGRTAVFGAVSLGSSPSPPATNKLALGLSNPVFATYNAPFATCAKTHGKTHVSHPTFQFRRQVWDRQ